MKYAGIQVVVLLGTGKFCVKSVFMRHCEASCRSGKVGGWEQCSQITLSQHTVSIDVPPVLSVLFRALSDMRPFHVAQCKRL